MEEAKLFVKTLFKNHQIPVPDSRMAALDAFVQDEQNIAAIRLIIQKQQGLMTKWKLEDRIAEIRQQPVRVLNATVGKPYETSFDFKKLKWTDITQFEWEGLEATGLHYDEKTKQITGVPTQSGDINLTFKFKLEGQPDDAPFNEKKILLIINPDPKSLWKNVESDAQDPYWKQDNVTAFAALGNRHILAASRRGRAHANVGSFREDDFLFKELNNGWSIIALADGAGSAKLSRKGSALACSSIVEYFTQTPAMISMVAFDDLLQQQVDHGSEDTQKKLTHFVYNLLGKGALHVHKTLQGFATDAGCTLKDLNTTLIFTLIKQYKAGYALLSFSVGDCPIAVITKNTSEVVLMNWLDVGEFGGGTRFITMPEIFKSEKFASRFSFKLLPDFDYLVMMSDGIYDPKFVVEANLPDIKKWKAFFADLNGKNEDGTRVTLRADNGHIKEELAQWMDFWSAGNHDDRTLVIVF